MINHKQTSILAKRKAKERQEAAASAAALVFVTLAESDDAFDPTALGEHSALFDVWARGTAYKAGQIRIDESDGVLYRCLASHGAEHAENPPSDSPTLWGRVADPAEEYPEWFPYSGVSDAWMTGSKCMHDGKRWISKADYNVWEPGATDTWEEVM
jgi:hypothetical protein